MTVFGSFSFLPDDILARRAAMRSRALAAREAAPARQYTAWVAAIESHLDALIATLAPRTLAFCWPYRAEADLRAWVARWLDGGAERRAALPVVLERAAPLLFRPWRPGTALTLDRHGITCPREGEPIEPELVLAPLNAFDARGYRLGYGGGYFDRTFARMRPLTVGIGFELGREADVLPLPHDIPLDWLVTEAGAARAAIQRAEDRISPAASLPHAGCPLSRV
jgi:5,10-methenyltetrahydrofolate synthetase